MITMPDITGETHQKVRALVENEGDYLLRVARISQLRLLLGELELEAVRNVKPIDMPLWYVEKKLSYYGIYSSSGIESGSFVLVREDVDPDQLKWISDNCSGSYWYGDRQPGEPYDHKSHPLYPGFSTYVTIGNKVTAAKRYFQAQLRVGADNMRECMIKRLGPKTWTKSELPRDINGKTIWQPIHYVGSGDAMNDTTYQVGDEVDGKITVVGKTI